MDDNQSPPFCIITRVAYTLIIIFHEMEVEEHPSTSTQLQQQQKAQPIPTTITEFFESEQYMLASSGFLTPIVSILIGNPKLHKQLIQSMFLIETNQSFNNTTQQLVPQGNPNLPFKVFDLFSNFEDVYTNYMFGYNSGSTIQNNGKQLLLQMFQVFRYKQTLNQTSAGYLYRILDLVFTRNDSSLFFHFLEEHPQIIDKMVWHMDSPTSSNIILKSFQTGIEEIPTDNKISIIRKVILGVVEILKEKIQNADDLVEGLKFFCQKLLDKNITRKIGTSQLSQYILDSQIVESLCGILLDKQFEQAVQSKCLEIIILMLKQFKIQESSKSRGSLNKSNKYFGTRLAKVKLIQPSPESVKILTNSVSIILQTFLQSSNSTSQERIFSALFTEVLSLIALYLPNQFKQFINIDVVLHLLKTMPIFAYNNLFHASVRDIVIVTISDKIRSQLLMNNSDFSLISFIHQNFIKNKFHCFDPFLYDITHQIIQKTNELDLNQLIVKNNKDHQWKQIIKKYEIVRENRSKKFDQKMDDDEQQLTTRPSQSQDQETKKQQQSKPEQFIYKTSQTQTKAQFEVYNSQKMDTQMPSPTKEYNKSESFPLNNQPNAIIRTFSDPKVKDIFIPSMVQETSTPTPQNQQQL